ncbi:unnamed protein product, partial [marine sediment metagenome]
NLKKEIPVDLSYFRTIDLFAERVLFLYRLSGG